MNGGLARMITLASCAVGMLAVSHGAEPGTSTAASSPLPVGGGDRLNIDLVKSLDGTGGYIRLEGRSLFLTSNVNPKAQQAGFWFDIGPDPAAPALLKKSLPGAWDVATVGDHAFVCDYTKSLTVCDLRKHQWQQVAKLDMPSMTENIALRGTLAYVANHTAGLTIVSIAEPSKPSIVSNFNPRIDCDGLALWGDFAVLYGHAQSRLVLVDVTDPAKPRQIGVYQHDKGSFNQGEVDVDGGWAYCTSVNGLVIVNIADPANPKLAKTVDLKSVSDVTVKDGYAFVAARANGVRVLDVADPANPIELGRYVARGRLTALQLAVERVAPAASVAPAPAQDIGKPALDPNPASKPPLPVPASSYYIYVANANGPALVMLFRTPKRDGAAR